MFVRNYKKIYSWRYGHFYLW